MEGGMPGALARAAQLVAVRVPPRRRDELRAVRLLGDLALERRRLVGRHRMVDACEGLDPSCVCATSLSNPFVPSSPRSVRSSSLP